MGFRIGQFFYWRPLAAFYGRRGGGQGRSREGAERLLQGSGQGAGGLGSGGGER